jgi:hypothetical protein
MSRKVTVVTLLVGSLALACTEGTGPSFDEGLAEAAVVPQTQLHHVKWAMADTPQQFTVVGGTPEMQVLQAAAVGSSGGYQLDNYQVSFWAVKGQDRAVQINYVQEYQTLSLAWDASYSKTITSPYLRFTVPAGALDEGPNGEEYEHGDSVQITITIDPTDMVAHYEPSGLEFDDDDPAVLQVWYTGANGDYDGDGYVTKEDSYIESNLLGMWWQQGPGYPWYRMPGEQSLSERWFRAELEHFSGYAVSWME